MKITLNLFMKWFTIISLSTTTVIYAVKSEVSKQSKNVQIENLKDSIGVMNDSLNSINISYEKAFADLKDSLERKTVEIDSIKTVLINIKENVGIINADIGYINSKSNNGVYYYVKFKGVKYKINTIVFHPAPSSGYSEIGCQVVYMWDDPIIEYK